MIAFALQLMKSVWARTLSIFFVPVVAYADIVPPCEQVQGGGCVWGWNSLMGLAYNITHFLAFDLALPVAAISFAVAGFKLLTNGASEEARKNAKSTLGYTVLGLIFAFGAYAIVKFVIAFLFTSDVRSTLL
ncbi:MAG: TrbC/VirB2 family protein [Minisyncoccota bacterium]